MQFKSFMEALKGDQHKLDKNKNGKVDAHDFKLLRKEEEDIEEGVDRVERADFKTNPSGRKSHKEITFKNDDAEVKKEEVELEERSMTDAEMKKREDYVKGMKKNISSFKDKYGAKAKDVMYATATKMAMKEELDEALDPSEIAGNPKMYDAATAKKAYYHKSASASDKESLARHLDRHHGNKEWRKAVKEDLDEAMINGREYASHGLMHPDHAAHAVHKVTGSSIDFYAHGTGDKVEGKVTKNDGKAVHIKDTKGTTHKFKVQRGLPKQQNEQAPVAPSLMKHRISVTVSDPDHTMVSKRKEKMQKTVIVTHSDNKEGAQKVGEKFYKKKGYRVHDSHHAGMVNEEVELSESHFKVGDKVKCKASGMSGEVVKLDKDHGADDEKYYTVKRDDGKEMKYAPNELSLKEEVEIDEETDTSEKTQMAETQLHFIQYAAEEITGFIKMGGKIEEWYQNKLSKVHSDMESLHSYMEGESRRTGMKEEVESIDEISSKLAGNYYGAATKKHIDKVGIKPNMYGRIEKDMGAKRKAGVDRAMDRITGARKTNEETNQFDEEGNLMAEKLKFSDFIAKMNEQLLEYESDDSGVYRHTKKATYGTSYQGDDDEDEKPKKPAADAPKRGRGRPAGSSGASYKPRSAETKAAAAAKAAATKAANKK